MKTSKCFDRASCSWDCKPRITGLIHDPVEESEAYLSIKKELEEKLRSYFSDKKFDSGSGFAPRSHASTLAGDETVLMGRLWDSVEIPGRIESYGV